MKDSRSYQDKLSWQAIFFEQGFFGSPLEGQEPELMDVRAAFYAFHTFPGKTGTPAMAFRVSTMHRAHSPSS